MARGVITKTVPPSLLDTRDFPVGKEVNIARIIRTPAGLSFRVFQSTNWIPEEYIKCDFRENLVVDYVKIARDRMNYNELKPEKVSAKTKTVSGMRPKLGNKGRTIAMDKKELKEVIGRLSTGDTFSVTFLSTMPSDSRYDGIRGFAGQTVEFTLVGTRTGRGKGGSQLMDLKPTAGGDSVVTGTPHSEALLNVRLGDGTVVGHETETEIPKTFETNAGQAASLKEAMKGLADTTGARVRVQSTEAEFDGEYTVTSVLKMRGRHGQIRLSLTADDGRTTELSSYRHSGVVTSFEVLTPGTVVASNKPTAKSKASKKVKKVSAPAPDSLGTESLETQETVESETMEKTVVDSESTERI